jgi:DNA polymerase-3 subunit alpha
LEQPALAITDHGNLHAAWEFQEKAKKAKIKPILGMEAYVAPGSRLERGRQAPGVKPYYHLVLLARDAVGYKNLVKLSSLAYTEGFYVKPRVDRELLAAHSEGLIVSSACLAGEVAGHLMDDRWDAAKEAAEWYANVFKDRYYLEVQAHDSEGQAQLNERIFRLGQEVGLPVIATNDAHFLKRDDHDAHDVLLCIGLGTDREDQKRMHYDRGLYFKSYPEMAERFPKRADVLENTLRIADEIDVQFGKKYHVPSFPLPAGVATENDLLVKLATEGAMQRYAGKRGAASGELPTEVKERLDYELGVILQTGYSGYFLIVADFIKAARDRGIPVGPGRGSAAGSIVAYSLGITNVCPLDFDLLFERFLNPERVSMPDVDVDFCFERRGEVIEYVRQKYGKESVCQIVTFGTMKSRAAIKDVGRVLGFTPAETDQLAKLIPNQPNFSLTIAEAIEQVPDVARYYKTEPRYTELLDYAKALEGLSRHTGVHAAGVVIAPGPVSDFVPVCTQSSKGAGGEGGDEKITVAQYDMNCLEKAGMLKMDFLGLTTLTVIHDALKSIEARTGQWLDLDAMSFDDVKTYQMLRSGRTAGVFQFESPLATDVLRQMRCDRFDDLVASNALLRPGPLDTGMHKVYIKRKRGEEPVTYQLPEMEPILRETQGVITYQEQVMRIAQTLAGISLAEADVLRKAVGKKDAELIRAELGKFTEKAVAKGHDRAVITDIAGQIETFGRYGFNKSHSVAYSVVSYHTAYLKANYPADFMAALLSSCIGKTEDVVRYIAEAREMGIEVLPPDVNESGYKFTVVGEKRIRFGLGAVRNVGQGAVESVLASRATDGAYKSFFDFVERVDLRACNKRVFEALVCAGALDGLGGHRAQYLAALDTAISGALLKQQEREHGQFGLGFFGENPDDKNGAAQKQMLPNLPAWSEGERLTREKEILGFYVSGHPLEPFSAEAEIFGTHKIAELGAWTPEPITLACVVTAVKKQISKRSGAEFARLTLEDFSGSSEVLVFPEAWSAIGDSVKTDVPVLVEGGYSKRDQGAESPTFIVEKVTRLAEKRVGGQVAIAIELAPGAGLAPSVMRDVRATCDAYPGSAPLELRWRDDARVGSGTSARFRSRSLTVAPSNAVLSELRALLGDDRVRLVRA